jgi:uncharacterized membrane protein
MTFLPESGAQQNAAQLSMSARRFSSASLRLYAASTVAAGRMGKRRLGNLARTVRFVAAPVAEGAAEAVNSSGSRPHPLEDFGERRWR